jgi:hypothetical protein
VHRRRYPAVLSTALVGCTDDGITVRRFEVRQSVVDLEYAPAEATEASVEDSVRTAGRAYYDRIYGGWDVGRLDAAAFVDGSLLVTWHMESEWVQQHRDGDISREELDEKSRATVERYDE